MTCGFLSFDARQDSLLDSCVRKAEVGYLLFNGPNELVSAQNIVIVES